jgi:hypothetical protein
MKAYTDLEQSKKLAEFMPLESAGMFWRYNHNIHTYDDIPKILVVNNWDDDYNKDIPCWSLAALLNYLREIDFFPEIEADEYGVTMSINYYDEEEARLLAPVHNIKVKAESFIDACVAMIEKLHELKIL